MGNKTTFYVRDASGNVMAIYENGNSGINAGKLSQIEVDLYGSSRIGLWQSNRDVESTNWWLFDKTAMPGTNGGTIATLTRGKTSYELSNHLGNVLVTVSDRKLQVSAGGTSTDYYAADVITATDYYPFGLDMPGRKFGNENRYGFNDKERDKDMHSLTAYDYGFRIYNPAIGKFLSVDPLSKEYPWNSSYSFAEGDPINFIDLDGLEKWMPAKKIFDGTYSAFQSINSSETPSSVSVTNNKRVALEKASAARAAKSHQTLMDQLARKPSGRTNNQPQNTIGPDRSTWYTREQSDLRKAAIERGKAIQGATMDPVAGAIAYNTVTTAKDYVQGVVSHGEGIVNGIREGDGWKIGGNTILLGLDAAPFIPMKGSGSFGKVTETFLYRFDTRSPVEIMKAGGFKAWGTNDDLILHANGITTATGSQTSVYIATSTDLAALLKEVGSAKGFIYKIKPQSTGKDVNKILGSRSPHPQEMEVAVPHEIKAADIMGYKPNN